MQKQQLFSGMWLDSKNYDRLKPNIPEVGKGYIVQSTYNYSDDDESYRNDQFIEDNNIWMIYIPYFDYFGEGLCEDSDINLMRFCYCTINKVSRCKRLDECYNEYYNKEDFKTDLTVNEVLSADDVLNRFEAEDMPRDFGFLPNLDDFDKKFCHGESICVNMLGDIYNYEYDCEGDVGSNFLIKTVGDEMFALMVQQNYFCDNEVYVGKFKIEGKFKEYILGKVK